MSGRWGIEHGIGGPRELAMCSGAALSGEEKDGWKDGCMAGLRYAHRSVLSVMPTGGAGRCSCKGSKR